MFAIKFLSLRLLQEHLNELNHTEEPGNIIITATVLKYKSHPERSRRMAFMFLFAVRTGMILLRRIGPFHPEVIWSRNAKPLLLRSKCFFVFRHSYSNKFSTSIRKTKNPMRNHRVLHFLRCGRDSNPRPTA